MPYVYRSDYYLLITCYLRFKNTAITGKNQEIFSKFSENSRKTQCVDEIVQIRYNNFIYGFFKAAV